MASKILYIANIPGFEYDSQGPLWVDEIVLTSKTSALLHLSDTDSGFNTLTFLKWDNDLLFNNQYSATEEKVDDPKTKEQYSFTLAEDKLIRIKSNGSANYFLDYLKIDDSSEETLRQLPGKVIHHYLTWTSHLPGGYPKNFDDYEHRGLCYFKTADRKERFVVNCKMYSCFNGKKILLQDKDVTYDFTGSTVDTGNVEFRHPGYIRQYYDINLGEYADVHIEMPNPNEEENNCLIPVAMYNNGGYIKLEYNAANKFYDHSEEDSNKYTITSENSQLCILPQAHGDIKNDHQFKDSSVYITNTSKILTCFRYNDVDEEYLTPGKLDYNKSKWADQKLDLEHQQIAWDYYEPWWKRLNAQGLLNHGFLLPNLTLTRSGDSVETDLNYVLHNAKGLDWVYKINLSSDPMQEILKKFYEEKKNIYENFLEPYVVKSKYRSKEISGHLNADYDHGCFGVLYDAHLDDQWFFDKSIKLPKYDKWLDTNFKDESKTSNYLFFLYFLLQTYYGDLVKFFDLKTLKQDYVILNKFFLYNLTKSNFKQTDYLYKEAPKVTIANISKCRSELINLIPTEVGIISSIDGYIALTYNGDINKVSVAKETKPGIHKLSPKDSDSFKDVIMFKDDSNIKTKEFSLKEGSNTLTTEIRLVVHKNNKQAKRGGLVAFLPNSLLVALPLPKNNASSYGVIPSYYSTSILEGEDNNSTQYLGWGKNDRGEWDFVPTTLNNFDGEPINILQNISFDEPVQLTTASFKDEISTIKTQEISFDLQPQQLYVLLTNRINLNGTLPCIIRDSNSQPLLTISATLEVTLKVVFYTNNSYPSCKLSILESRKISGIGLYAINTNNKDAFFNTVEHDETSNVVVLQPSDYEDFVVVPAAFCYKEKDIKCGYQTYNHTCVPIFPFCEVLGYYTVDYKKDPTNLVVIDPVNKDACDAFDKKKGNIKARIRIQ